jgi:hypothetical protein
MDRTVRTTEYKCSICKAALIPTYAVANESMCVACRMKQGKPTKLAKGSYACYLNSKPAINEPVQHKSHDK